MNDVPIISEESPKEKARRETVERQMVAWLKANPFAADAMRLLEQNDPSSMTFALLASAFESFRGGS